MKGLGGIVGDQYLGQGLSQPCVLNPTEECYKDCLHVEVQSRRLRSMLVTGQIELAMSSARFSDGHTYCHAISCNKATFAIKLGGVVPNIVLLR